MLPLPTSRARRWGLLALSLFFVVAGINHFVSTAFYVNIMPPYLPAHCELVYLSGLAELIGGLAVLVPALRAAAGWGLILLLIAVFPANVHMAWHPALFAEVPAWLLYARLPFQGLFIAWAYWATRPETLEAAA